VNLPLLRRVARAPGDWLDRKLGTALARDADGVLRWLRKRPGAVKMGKLTMVVHDADVRAVTASGEYFGVGLYTPKLQKMAGPFALGVDDQKLHPVLRGFARHAVRDGDPDQIAARSGAEAANRVAAVRARGQIDVVSQLADPVLASVVPDHLGLRSVDRSRFVDITRIIFEEAFLNLRDIDEVRIRATRVARAFRKVIDRDIARSGPGDGDVLARLLEARKSEPRLTDEVIRATLIGLSVAWAPDASRGLALALDELLKRPDELADAQEAARAGAVDVVGDYIFEALRFRPPNAGALRQCVKDYDLGTLAASPIKAGTPMLAMFKSALRDETAVEDPEEFCPGRDPVDDLLFGYGTHRCVGEPIIRRQLPAMAMPVLQLPKLQRAPGPTGRLAWRGSFPKRLQLHFDM
jgi:cytochrome P450